MASSGGRKKTTSERIWIRLCTPTSMNVVNSQCAKQHTCFGQSGVALRYIIYQKLNPSLSITKKERRNKVYWHNFSQKKFFSLSFFCTLPISVTYFLIEVPRLENIADSLADPVKEDEKKATDDTLFQAVEALTNQVAILTAQQPDLFCPA
jgi:hypothetical protein